MLSRLALPIFILSTPLVAFAQVVPTGPSPNQVFNDGTNCEVDWSPDTTGTWKTLNIELMTGDNLNMVHLTTVASVDGTVSPGTFSYPCPDVTLHAAVYFYQFSTPAAPTKLTWTGRFAIADPTGATVPPPNATQPDGQAIPWGLGGLTNPSSGTPAPSYLQGGSNSTSSVSSTSANSTTSSLTTSTSTSSTTTGTTLKTLSTSSLSGSSSGTAAAASSTSTNSAGGFVVGAVSTRAAQAGVSLAVIAASFTFLF